MSESVKKIKAFIIKDPVLVVSVIAAAVSAFFIPPSLNYRDYIDVRVLCLLLSMMLAVAGLKAVGIFDFITFRLLKLVHNTRTLSLVLICVSFFGSMLITNDVALITFVPLAVLILTETNNEKLLIPVIVLQTVAANLGSMLTPLGNPQNLYLYSVSRMSTAQFLKVMAAPSLLSLLMLCVSVIFIKRKSIEPLTDKKSASANIKKAMPWLILLAVCLLSVVRVIPYPIALLAAAVCALIFDKKILLRADYGLLLTFVFLFIFIGNISNISAVSGFLSDLTAGNELTAGILMSQIISNVPAAMLLSKFTADYSALLTGVNLGGLGTLIASMASVISYKLYAGTKGAQAGKYLAAFTAVNILFLCVLWAVSAFTAL